MDATDWLARGRLRVSKVKFDIVHWDGFKHKQSMRFHACCRMAQTKLRLERNTNRSSWKGFKYRRWKSTIACILSGRYQCCRERRRPPGEGRKCSDSWNISMAKSQGPFLSPSCRTSRKWESRWNSLQERSNRLNCIDRWHHLGIRGSHTKETGTVSLALPGKSNPQPSATNICLDALRVPLAEHSKRRVQQSK